MNKKKDTNDMDRLFVLMTGMKGSLDKMSEDIAELKADVAELKADVVELKADVAELKADVAELKADVAELKADVAKLKTDVAELKTDVAKLKADVKEMKTEMGEVKGRLTSLEICCREMKADINGLGKIHREQRDITSFGFDTLEKGQLRIENEIKSIKSHLNMRSA